MMVVVDTGVANVGSIANMLKRIGAQALVSSRPPDIERATKLILPGVGAFDGGMRALRERGLIEVLNARALDARIPVLGLCLGMHILTRGSEEGELPGLGWLDARTVRFRFSVPATGLKVPHMGWNYVSACRTHPLLDGLGDEPRFYFVHSYHVECGDPALVLGQTSYGYSFPAAIARDNIMGVQFHPEKSHRFGMTILRNFVERV
jgi:glutamine amidotransferase